ncbi:MAG: CAP domain-containing protein, partial [Actinomycetota bacterium]
MKALATVRTLCGVIAGLGLLLLPSPAGGERGDNRCWSYSADESAFASLANDARADEGLDKLRLDPELSRVARKHTQAMVKDGVLRHSPDHQLSKRVTNWRVLGENVGMGGSPRSLHAAFMDSQA